jgi:hypothetical protein
MASCPNHIITVKGDESPYILLLRTTTRNTTSYLLLGTTTTPSPLTTIVRLRTTTNTTRQSHYFLPERKKKSWQPHLASSNKRKDAHTHTHIARRHSQRTRFVSLLNAQVIIIGNGARFPWCFFNTLSSIFFSCVLRLRVNPTHPFSV